MKSIKKLTLNKEVVSILTENHIANLKAGYTSVPVPSYNIDCTYKLSVDPMILCHQNTGGKTKTVSRVIVN